MSLGRVVGPCRGCGAKQVREAYSEIVEIRDGLGKRIMYRHTAVIKQSRQDPGRPCRGAVIPTDDYLRPPPQQHSIDAWKTN